MAARTTFTALGSALFLSTLAAGGARAQTSLSVYADGRVVVRRALPQPLDKGRNTVVLKEAIDPATIFSPDTAVALVAAQARGATTQQEALARARGQTLAFAREKDTIRATVVSVEPPQYRLGDGRFLLATPGTPLFPAEPVPASHRDRLQRRWGVVGGGVPGGAGSCRVSGVRGGDDQVPVGPPRQRGGAARGGIDRAGALAPAVARHDHGSGRSGSRRSRVRERAGGG